MVGTLVHQLIDGASIEEIEKGGLSAYYTDYGLSIYHNLLGDIHGIHVEKRFYMNDVDKAIDKTNDIIIKNNISRSTPGMNWGICKD